MDLQKPRHAPSGHPAIQDGRVGVILMNIGTPEALNIPALRRYLRTFLSDPRVIEAPRWLWWFALRFILAVRPRKVARGYAAIWDHERDISPLLRISQGQARGLEDALGHPDVVVRCAMRYSAPTLESVLPALAEEGCRRILLLPLYPQYSATTTASTMDNLGRVLKGLRWQPAVRVVPPFYDDPAYIGALAKTVKRALTSIGEVDRLALSYHGIPQMYFERGDPYHCHCAKTSRLLREALGRDEAFMPMVFQSRVGPQAWLQPYTEEATMAWGREGVRRLAVMTPGFMADCLETLEEIGEELRATFLEAGGEEFHFIPSLNDATEGIELLRTLVVRELSGWVTFEG